ncbi:hypothetical protein KQI84_03670 [bacterium]|nr:hypothetical protein [bacterium]
MSATEQAVAAGVPTTRGPRLRSLRRALIGRGFLGKDIVQFASLWVAIGLAFSLILIGQKIVVLWHPGSNILAPAPVWFVLFLNIFAYALGLAMYGEEEESESRLFANRLPVSAIRLVFAKLLSGLLLIASWSVVFLPIGLWLNQAPHNATRAFPFGELFFLGSILSVFLLVAGMTAAAWHRRTMIAAFAGFVEIGLVWMVFYQAAMAFFPGRWIYDWASASGLNADNTVFGPLRTLLLSAPFVAPLGIPLLLLLLGIRVSKFEDVPAESSFRFRALGRAGTARGGLSLRTSASYRILHVPTLLVGILAGLIAPIALVRFVGAELTPIIHTGCAVVFPMFLGAIACVPIERYSPEFFINALPVSRRRHESQRILGLLIAAFVLAVALVGSGLFLGSDAILRASNRLIEWLSSAPSAAWGLVYILYDGAVLFLIAAASILLGYLFRLYCRSIIISPILTALPAIAWYWVIYEVSGDAMMLMYMPDVRPFAGLLGGLSALVWPAIVAIGLPILAIWITTCRSPLLEQSERRRTAIAILLALLLTTWGGMALSVSPIDILTIIRY